jgi:hypothetical protein
MFLVLLELTPPSSHPTSASPTPPLPPAYPPSPRSTHPPPAAPPPSPVLPTNLLPTRKRHHTSQLASWQVHPRARARAHQIRGLGSPAVWCHLGFGGDATLRGQGNTDGGWVVGLCQWKIEGAALAPWRWILHPHELMHLEVSRCPLSSSASFDFVPSSLRCPYRLDPRSDCTRDPPLHINLLFFALVAAMGGANRHCSSPPRQGAQPWLARPI